MQFAKRSSTKLEPIRGKRKELQTLYARRSAIDALIESLQAYQRHCGKPADCAKRKTA